MNKGLKIATLAILALVIGLAIATYFILSQKKQMALLEENMTLQKEELEDEYTQLAIQYEGYRFNVKNDSLLYQLDNEKMKVQRLLEELKTVKSTNTVRINELKKELSTLRGIMRGLVIQIDSLNALNQRLKTENTIVTKRYEEVTKQASKLAEERETLSQQVTLASKLDATSIVIEALDKRNKRTTKISRAEQLRFNFNITKNVTAETGEKYIYVRIMKPDGDILVKSRGDLFDFEGSQINYSARRLITYGGEETPVSIFWNIDEFLYPGNYRLDIFADNYLIGSKEFSLEK